MKNSILTRFIITYISFALLGFMLITYCSTNLVYNRLLSVYVDQVYSYTRVVTNALLDETTKNLSEIKEPEKILKDFNDVLNCDLLVLDSENTLLYTTDTTTNINNSSSNIVIQDFDPKDYGSEHYRINRFYNIFNTDTLSVMHGVVKDDKTLGYVVAHMPTSVVKQSSYTITIIFYITYVIILGLSLIIFVSFWWNIYIPLRQIRLAAMEYANGNFEYDKLKALNDDEIGDVANSLQYMASQLNNAQQYQKDFISNISHDFRSPLTSIKGYIEAMLDGTIPPEDYKQYLSIVLSEANRLQHLSTGLRDLNTWNSTGPELIFEDFDFEQVIVEASNTFQGSCEKKHIELILQFPSEHSLVNGDKGKLQQVLYNLLDNAIKFSDTRSQIIIKLYNQGDKQYCSVKDFGLGIAPDALDKIWQRFYKSDLSRGRNKTGSGIGLAIVKEIIMAHNETIDVISTEGVGTEFVFSMKRVK